MNYTSNASLLNDDDEGLLESVVLPWKPKRVTNLTWLSQKKDY